MSSVFDLSVQQLWLPGAGAVPPHIRQAMQAVKDYDAELSLGRHEQTGDWVVLWDRGSSAPPFPVFGLGVDLPAPEEIKSKLYAADVRRHGGKLIERLERANAQRLKDERDIIDRETGIAAEGAEWAFRKEGRHPNPRIFIPRGFS